MDALKLRTAGNMMDDEELCKRLANLRLTDSLPSTACNKKATPHNGTICKLGNINTGEKSPSLSLKSVKEKISPSNFSPQHGSQISWPPGSLLKVTPAKLAEVPKRPWRPRFEPMKGIDSGTTTLIYCITAMPEYEGRSIEEVRYERQRGISSPLKIPEGSKSPSNFPSAFGPHISWSPRFPSEGGVLSFSKSPGKNKTLSNFPSPSGSHISGSPGFLSKGGIFSPSKSPEESKSPSNFPFPYGPQSSWSTGFPSKSGVFSFSKSSEKSKAPSNFPSPSGSLIPRSQGVPSKAKLVEVPNRPWRPRFEPMEYIDSTEDSTETTTLIYCITAMPEYEGISIEEARYERQRETTSSLNSQSINARLYPFNFNHPSSCHFKFSQSPGYQSKAFTQRKRCLSIKVGDLISEEVDAIVFGTDSKLNMSGEVGKAIHAKLDKATRAAFIDMPESGMIIISTGKSKIAACSVVAIDIKGLFCTDGANKWIEFIYNVLAHCDQNGIKSISFPLLGTGKLKLSPSEMSDRIFRAIRDFYQNWPHTVLREIYIVVSNKNLQSIFAREVDMLTSNDMSEVYNGWKISAQDGPNYEETLLLPSSDEYKQVERSFRKAFHCKSQKTELQGIFQIIKVRNVYRTKQFTLYQEMVATELKKSPTDVTKAAWHGSDASSISQICMKNFNRGFCGKNGIAYGKGVYFSTSSLLSANYSVRDDNGMKQVIRAQIVVGAYTQGKQTTVAPPHGYHSTVNSVSDPTIFVIYNDTSAIPEYVIRFKDK